jgi:TatD DNase family protein
MSDIAIYDTHAHLDYPELGPDLPAVLDRARKAGVRRIVVVGTDLRSSAAALRLCEAHEELYAAVGWHPCHVKEAPGDVRAELLKLAQHPKVVAIGETGLDYYHLPQPKDRTVEEIENLHAPIKKHQAEVFRQQLEVAAEANLNCIVHQRNSFEDTLALASEYQGKVRAVFHCFVSDVASMKRVLAIGGMVSFTGVLTFKNAVEVRETLKATPADSFMLETDSPYLAPVPHRGQRCEPAYTRHTAEAAAQVRGVDLGELARVTCANAHRFFPRLRPLQE